MLKHIVMWKLKEEGHHEEGKSKKESNALLAKEYLESLANTIPEIRKIEVGININPSEAAFDLVLYSEFDDEKGLECYQNHPDHLRVGEFIRKITETRVVVDYKA